VQALTTALQTQRLHHAYLFTGTRGIGKTTVSRILAKSLNCTGPDGTGGITAEPCGVCSACTEIDADRYIDYIELDAASNRSIDEIRDLIERAAYKPGIGRFKVFMIDEAHQLTKDAFNALLKTLEEPPDYLKFVLATTDPDKMLPTVLSRCLQFNLRPMAPATVREHLHRVLTAEGVPFDEGSLRLLARAARGSMRDGLSLTDQAIAYGSGRLDESVVRAMLGSVDRGHARAIVQVLAARDGAALLAAVEGLRALGLSAAATLEEVALLLQAMAVEQAVPGALDPEEPDTEDARALAPTMAADETQLLYSMVLHGRGELNLMSDEYAAMTMVLLRFLAFPAQGGEGSARVAEVPREPRSAPLRAPAPPAMLVTRAVPLPGVPSSVALSSVAPSPVMPSPVVPSQVPAPRPVPPVAIAAPAPEPLRVAEPTPVLQTPVAASPPSTPASPDAADRWDALVRSLCEQGTLNALLRESAMQAGLQRIDDSRTPPVWHLRVEREPLRSAALADKLAAVIGTAVGHAVQVQFESGSPADSPARRDAAERQHRQAQAEDIIHNDPVVRELLSQFKTARIVPGSIKPV
jgi:DNA polymerase-3 subunit gamma/tau